MRRLLLALALGVAASPLSAQNGGVPDMFFDCNGPNCNSQYYRTEIGWVNWVNDRAVADIHLIVTSQSTGSGGREYLLDFAGVGEYAGYSNQISYSTIPTDTDRETLDGITNAISVGVAHFAAQNDFRNLVRVEGLRDAGDAAGLVGADEVDDPWDLWVFRLNGSANFNGEDTRDSRRINSGFSASRVSPTWKMNFNGNVNYNRRRIELTEQPDFVDTRTDWGFTQLVVHSIADHWSVGFRGELRRLVSFNQAFRAELTPAVEYSFFPYEEATRRSLTAYYQIGPAYREYLETTIYGQDSEVRAEQSLELEFSQRQQWGDASISASASHFLHDTGLYNVSLRGNVDFRIVRGFSVNARGNVSRVQDQIYLAAGESSTEEELLDLVRRSQSFTYGIQVGFSWQFGSVFNNVVNNRFRGGGGGRRMFFF
ncbi:MAG: hypothetical protein WD995_05185 [Gemmatimonadota bacterium]